MTVGDILEVVAGALLVLAAAIGVGVALALLAAGLFVLYESQCLAGLPLPRRREKGGGSDGPAQAAYPDRATLLDEYTTPHQVPRTHVREFLERVAARKQKIGRVSGS